MDWTKAGKLALAAQLCCSGRRLTSAVYAGENTHVTEQRQRAEVWNAEQGKRPFERAAVGSFTRTVERIQPVGSVTVKREDTTTPDVVYETSKRETAHGRTNMPIAQVRRCYTAQSLVDCVTRGQSETLPNLHGLTRVARDLIPWKTSRWEQLGCPLISYWLK